MATELVLMDNVPYLGKVGETVKVANGYARNYLIPQQLAVPKDKLITRQLEKRKKIVAEKYAKELAEVKTKAKEFEGLNLEITVEVDANNSLFGAVSVKELAALLEEKSLVFERKNIVIGEQIRSIGSHTFTIRLHEEVQVLIKLEVLPKQREYAEDEDNDESED